MDKMVYLNPTEIGVRVAEKAGRTKVSGQAVNKILLSLGLQRNSESGYVLTEAGMEHGEMHDYKAENEHSGLQIDWYESVVGLVLKNLPAENEKRSKRTTLSRKQPFSLAGPQGDLL